MTTVLCERAENEWTTPMESTFGDATDSITELTLFDLDDNIDDI